MRSVARLALVAGIAVCVAVGGLGMTIGARVAFGNDETTRDRVDLPIEKVVVDAGAGDVDVRAAIGSGVEVTQTSSWLFSKPAVTRTLDARVLRLESSCRHGVLCDTDLTIGVPAGMAVEVGAEAGDVAVHGAPGQLTIGTSSGDVTLDLERAPRRIEAETDAGDIRVSVPLGRYAVATHTVAGDELVRGLLRHPRAQRAITVRSDVGDVFVEGR